MLMINGTQNKFTYKNDFTFSHLSVIYARFRYHS